MWALTLSRGLKIASFNRTQPQHNRPDFDREKQLELFYIFSSRVSRQGASVPFNLIRYDILLATNCHGEEAFEVQKAFAEVNA